MLKAFKNAGIVLKIGILSATFILFSIISCAIVALPLLSIPLPSYITKHESYIVLIITLISAIIGIFLSVFVVKSIYAPVRKITADLKQKNSINGNIANKIDISSKDDIGKMVEEINLFIDKTCGMLGQIIEVSQVMHTSSEELSISTTESNKSLEQIAQSINNIASGASESSNIVKETNTALEEVVNISNATAQISRNTVQKGVDVKVSAQNGANEVDNVIVSMEEIKKISNQITFVIKDLADSSKKIEDIVQVINGISDQTNLLALNAAIEASRAGESGKGFNVVAQEIRKLANESREAAKNIISLVQDNRFKSEKAAEFIEDSDTRISEGSQTVIAVGNHMKNIISNIEGIVGQMQEIDEAVIHQVSIINEIPYLMETISTTSDETAAGTQQISASVQEQLSIMEELETTSVKLAEMSEKFKDLISNFNM